MENIKNPKPEYPLKKSRCYSCNRGEFPEDQRNVILAQRGYTCGIGKTEEECSLLLNLNLALRAYNVATAASAIAGKSFIEEPAREERIAKLERDIKSIQERRK